jgi:hypothetical protein
MNGEDENQPVGSQVEDNSTNDTPLKKRFFSEHTDEQENEPGDTNHLIKKAKLEGTFYIKDSHFCFTKILFIEEQQVMEEDNPAAAGSLSINDHLFDDYNEESDQDWASGGSDSDSDGSSIDQGILTHPAFHMEDDTLDDVDVDGPEDEGQYQLGSEN